MKTSRREKTRNRMRTGKAITREGDQIDWRGRRQLIAALERCGDLEEGAVGLTGLMLLLFVQQPLTLLTDVVPVVRGMHALQRILARTLRTFATATCLAAARDIPDGGDHGKAPPQTAAILMYLNSFKECISYLASIRRCWLQIMPYIHGEPWSRLIIVRLLLSPAKKEKPSIPMAHTNNGKRLVLVHAQQ